MITIRLVSVVALVLCISGCKSRTKKLRFDPQTQIDCLLDEDEFVSERERLHAKDIARQYEAAQQQFADSSQKTQKPQVAGDDLVRLYEAKLADIPVPMGAKPIKNYFQSSSPDSREIVLGYVSSQSIEDIAAFYASQMEQFGWYQTAAFANVEHLMLFEKPDQICTISLRAHEGWFYQNGYSHIIIFRAER